MSRGEAPHIQITRDELLEAIYGFTPGERKRVAGFLIDAIRNSALFGDRAVEVSDVKLEVVDEDRELIHTISLESENEGRVEYELSEVNGVRIKKLTDGQAREEIEELFIKVGALIVVED